MTSVPIFFKALLHLLVPYFVAQVKQTSAYLQYKPVYLIWMLKGMQNRSTFTLTRSAFLTIVLFSQLSSSLYVKRTPSDLAVLIGSLIKELNNVPLCILPTTVLTVYEVACSD